VGGFVVAFMKSLSKLDGKWSPKVKVLLTKSSIDCLLIFIGFSFLSLGEPIIGGVIGMVFLIGDPDFLVGVNDFLSRDTDLLWS
jgi:hypothetical protein